LPEITDFFLSPLGGRAWTISFAERRLNCGRRPHALRGAGAFGGTPNAAVETTALPKHPDFNGSKAKGTLATLIERRYRRMPGISDIADGKGTVIAGGNKDGMDCRRDSANSQVRSLVSSLQAGERPPWAEAKAAKGGRGVGAQTTRGVAWTLLFSILNKGVAMGAQVGIAWFLSPKDIGLVATANSVVGILSMVMGGQLLRVLIQRQRTFEEDAGQVFWLAMVLNCSVAGAIAITASMVSRAFGDPQLKGLLWIVAASIPMMAFPVAYGAKLFIQLRFGLMSFLSSVQGVIQNVGGLLLAAMGMGPRSLVIPLLFSGIFASAAQRKAAGRIAFGRPQPSRWMPLVAPAFWVMLNAALTSGMGYGTNLIIAASHPMEVAGLYYWGFSMSAQAVFLLVTNLQGVLFPAFASMSDGMERQRSAFEQTTGVLTIIVVPIACLQVCLAQPVVLLAFHPRWLPAVPVIQWLSTGMLTQPLNVVGISVLMARGEYKKMVCATSVMAFFTLAAAFAGSRLGREREIAQWVGMATLLANVLPGWVACRSLGGSGRELWQAVRGPLLLGAPLACAAFLLNGVLGRWAPLPRVLLVSAAGALLYGGLVFQFCPELAGKVLFRLGELKKRA
jgi:O-antigen/teichoic acid export membrane protein